MSHPLSDVEKYTIARKAAKMMTGNWAMIDTMIKMYFYKSLSKSEVIEVLRLALEMMEQPR